VVKVMVGAIDVATLLKHPLGSHYTRHLILLMLKITPSTNCGMKTSIARGKLNALSAAGAEIIRKELDYSTNVSIENCFDTIQLNASVLHKGGTLVCIYICVRYNKKTIKI
jgi:hypothetical protein